MKKPLFIFTIVLSLFLLFICLCCLISFENFENKDLLRENLLGLKNFYTGDYKEMSVFLLKKTDGLKINNKFKSADYTPLYFSIEDIGQTQIEPLVVVNSKDWSSNEAILETVLPDIDSLSSEEKAIRLLRFVSENIHHFYPPDNYIFGNLDSPVVNLNIIGYCHCARFAYTLAILADKVGFEARVVYLNGEEHKGRHIVTEIYYDGGWHMFDADRGIFYWEPDGRIASVVEIIQNPSLIDPKLPLKNSTTESQKETFEGGRVDDIKYKDVFLADLQNDISYKLYPGEEIRFYYDFKGDWFWSDFSDEPPLYTNGLLITPVNEKTNLQGEELRKIELPYPILASYIYGKDICNKASDILFSLDGKTWMALDKYCRDDVVRLGDTFPKGKESKMTLQYFLKINDRQRFPKMLVYTQFQVAPNAIPRLKEGENMIQMGNIDRGKIKLNFAFKNR